MKRLGARKREIASSFMPSAVKGGLFVGAAVTVGIVAGLLVPSLVVAERDTASRPQQRATPLPTMPSLVGRTLKEAESELDRRGIPYSTDAPHLVQVLAPTVLEVCATDPPVGQRVRGQARVRAALAGTCSI
jgi:PASTA domain